MTFINHYAHTMAQQNFVMECGFPVTVYELLLWLSSFVTDCCVVRGLPVMVYMSWGCSTQLAQYSNFMDKMAMKISCLTTMLLQYM